MNKMGSYIERTVMDRESWDHRFKRYQVKLCFGGVLNISYDIYRVTITSSISKRFLRPKFSKIRIL